MKKILVVGAGFSGATIARTLADTQNYLVDVIDARNHIAGNAYDPVHPKTAHRYHKYGPHIFHTSNNTVVEFLSRFTTWIKYIHKVKVILPSGASVPLPINIQTINAIFDLTLNTASEMSRALDGFRTKILEPSNALEYLLSLYGPYLTELLFARYTRKMWELELADIPLPVVERIATRFNRHDHYFNDSFQFMPADGYVSLIGNMLDHQNIQVFLSTSFDRKMEKRYAHVFNGMSIDTYFDCDLGRLPYRSIIFEHRYNETFEYDVATVNFADEGIYTRKTDWSLYPSCGGLPAALVTYEIPCSYEDNHYERYYPVKTIDGRPQKLYHSYKKRAAKLPNTTFIGRCGRYTYYDMHHVVAKSLDIAKHFVAQS